MAGEPAGRLACQRFPDELARCCICASRPGNDAHSSDGKRAAPLRFRYSVIQGLGVTRERERAVEGGYQDSVTGRERLEPDLGRRHKVHVRLLQANAIAAAMTLAWVAVSSSEGTPPQSSIRTMLAFFMGGLICLALTFVVRAFGENWNHRTGQLAEPAMAGQLRYPLSASLLSALALCCFVTGLVMGGVGLALTMR